jgi:hypothetical protein
MFACFTFVSSVMTLLIQSNLFYYKAIICLSLEEVTVPRSLDNVELIVGDLQGILDQQLSGRFVEQEALA